VWKAISTIKLWAKCNAVQRQENNAQTTYENRG
jgi:hypothetical protein